MTNVKHDETNGSTLLLCPFCGGKANTAKSDIDCWSVICANCNTGIFRPRYDPDEWNPYSTEAEAIAAWNTRAAYEMDGWFYLPKPKQQLFSYTDGFSLDDLSLKATGTVDVYAMTSAVQKWQEEALNAQIVERICEVFKPERTCEMETDHDELEVIASSHEDTWAYKCSACDWSFRYDRGIKPNYCPNCGARTVD